jgi:hypothetical protein
MTTLRDNIQRLVDRKLVRRAPNPDDGRSYLLRLTPRGRRVVEAASDALLDAYVALERRLPRPLSAYERALDELNACLELTRRDLTASHGQTGARRVVRFESWGWPLRSSSRRTNRATAPVGDRRPPGRASPPSTRRRKDTRRSARSW